MGLAHSPRIATDGLVLALDAGNTKSYPGSGTTWNDLIGGNDATIIDSSSIYQSNDGGRIVFDGSADYVTIPASSNYDFGTGNFTIDWFSSKANTTSNQVLLASEKYYNLGYNGNWLLKITNAGTITLNTYDGRTNVEGANFSASTSANVWNHFALVREGTGTNQTKFYLDGVLAGSMTISKSLSDAGSSGFRIGKEPPGGPGTGNYLNGYFSNLRVYKGKALTAAEVQQNYNALKGRYA